MNPKIILCLALVLSGGLLGCSTASRHVVSKLDLTAYRIDQVLNKNDVPYDGSNWRAWQNFLVFSNSNIRLPLARSAVAPGENYGFDPASLKLQWLKQDKLLLISWTTFHLGSGGYTHDGNVILQIHGDQGRELFRDHIESIAKAGWAAQEFSSLKIAYNDSDRTFKFTRRNTAINGNMGVPDIRRPYPFTTTFTNDAGEAGYISKVHMIDTWHYKLVGSRLKFLRGSSAVDVGDEAQPIEEIVKGFDITRAALELMNPGIPGQQEATGVVFLNKKFKAYEISSDDGLHGDK
jgi:hypothetical protein